MDCFLQPLATSLPIIYPGHNWLLTHPKTDESPVAENFNSGTHTVSDMAVMAIDLVCSNVYGRSEKAGGSGPWELCPLREWISGSIVCKPAPSLMPLDAFVPLSSWLQLRHPMKKINIWTMYLNVDCGNDLYECNVHCIILFVCVLAMRSISYHMGLRVILDILRSSYDSARGE